MQISVVIPVYESTVLEELAARLEAVLTARGDDYELIFVDDGSPSPGTWPTLERLARQRPRVRAIRLTRNFGQQAATLCGLQAARGDRVVTIDDDLQHQPEDLPRLLEPADVDLVFGQFPNRRHRLWKRLASRAKGFFDRILLGKPTHIQLTSYRVLSRAVVDGVLTARTPHPFLPALLFHVSRQAVGVNVDHAPRSQGQSGYTLRRLIAVFSNLVLNNSSFLLRLVGQVGLVFAAVSFVIAGVVIYRRLASGVSVQGWTSIFATLLLIGGLLLVSVGVIGEYLIRIIASTEGRPAYFVRTRAGFEAQPDV